MNKLNGIISGAAIIIAVLSGTPQKIKAQTVLLHVDRAVDSIPSRVGPNLPMFVHWFIAAGLTADKSGNGAPINNFLSPQFSIGIRNKFKLSPVFSAGYELGFRTEIYKLDQTDSKQFPDTIKHQAARLGFSSVGLSAFLRTNFDPGRGNVLGKFIDLGIHGGWNFDSRYVVKEKAPDGSKIKIREKGLPYTEAFESIVFVRLGFYKASIFVNRRLTDLFKNKYNLPELPLYHVGIEMALY